MSSGRLCFIAPLAFWRLAAYVVLTHRFYVLQFGLSEALPRLTVWVALTGHRLRFALPLLGSDAVWPLFRLSEAEEALLLLTLWRANFSVSSGVLSSWRCLKYHFRLAPLTLLLR